MKNFHSLKIKETLDYLKSDKNGLRQEEAEKRIEKYGFNELPEGKKVSKFTIFFSQFNNALVIILLFAGIVSAFLGEAIDASVIFGAVLINVMIGFIQESKASNAIEKIKNLVKQKAFVLRNGHETEIESKYLTVGDIIFIKAGNIIPADARLIESANLSINESSMTGESVPAKKNIKEVSKGAALADRENMVYASSIAVRGLGLAVVTGIGIHTEIGKIAQLVKDAHEDLTPLQKRLAKFSRQLGVIFAVVCAIIVVAGLAQDREFIEMFETGVAVGVASIPEGLTVAVTFILALGMQQILKKKALTKKLVAAETLGSITTICTDKTGTLTEGRMHVAHIVIGTKEFEIDTLGSRQDSEEAKAVSLALQAGMMCNTSVVENPDDELASWRFIGSSTEVALMSAAIQSGLRKEKLLKIEKEVDILPFESDTKYMSSLHDAGNKQFIMYEKGAPERLLKKSTKFYHQGKVVNLGTKEVKELRRTYEQLTSRGLRVIGVAMKEIDNSKSDFKFVKGGINWGEIDNELTFIGFIAIKDPLRVEAKETIQLAMKAGIRPVIITGDHKLTARAIGEEVGLKVSDDTVITGEELEKISDEELVKLVKEINIYARVSPHHKLRIVNALQKRGEVVAMTGDGINDSPALKTADIGIALGTGTDIAKEAADIILLDDNFSTIVDAIKQGRVIFKNIRKVITYLISDSFSEMILIVGSIIFGVPLAILPVQILWINIVNDGMPHFSLAFEKGDDKIMERKPISRDAPLLNMEMKYIIFGAGILRDLLLLGLFFILLKDYDIEYIQTVMFFTLGVKSLMSIFSLRGFRRPIWNINPFSNKYLLLAVSGSFALLLMGVYFPPLQKILHTVPVDFFGWSIAFGFGFISIAFIEIVKQFYKNKNV